MTGTPDVIDLTDDDTTMYPPAPTFLQDSFSQNLQAVTAFNKRQVTNLALALHTLAHHDYKRWLDPYRTGSSQRRDLSDTLDIHQLTAATGVHIERIDTKLHGKGTEFTRIKKSFDKTSTVPMGLLSFGMEPNLLIGTNFDRVDAMVTVGSIDTNILTQAINRIFRPRASRDNSLPMVMVKIFS